MQGRLENEIKVHQNTTNVIATMPKFIEEWYINLKASRKTASSCYQYIMYIRKFFEYINGDALTITPDKITLQACESYMIACQTKIGDNGMEVFTSDSHQLAVWCAMNSLLDFMVKRNYIQENYMDNIQKPKNQDPERVKQTRVLLTANDFKKILNTAKKGDVYINKKFADRNVAIILLFLITGIRCSALSEINISDIDFENKTLNVVDKGNKSHLYTLNDEFIKYVNKWLKYRKNIVKDKTSDALFINKNGYRISSRGVSDLVSETCYAALGKKLTPHKLRSGFCSILYDKTHDIEFVRRAVGHANTYTTQKYIKTDNNEKERAIQIMDNVLKI